MEDIAPSLLDKIKTRFSERITINPKLRALYKSITDGAATYADAYEYAYLVGDALSLAFGEFITPEVLPDGKLYFNIAQRVVRPMLAEDHQVVSDATVHVQKALNNTAGIGIKPQTVPLDEDRVAGIVDKISNAEKFEDISWMLDAPVKNFSMHVVDETLRANVDFQGRSGLRPKVVRKAHGKRCAWCRNWEGEFDYPDVPQEVYQRHENCRCTVDYTPGDGRWQNVHSKQWTGELDRGKIAVRKNINLLSTQMRRYEADVIIPKSVGAKGKGEIVNLPNGERVGLVPGSSITHVQTIAGLGRDRGIDIVDILVDRYPNSDATLWQKKKGIGFVDYHGESYRAELHWYEEPTVGRVRMKVKPDADGNWFFEYE